MEKLLEDLRQQLAKANPNGGKRRADFVITYLRGAAAASDAEQRTKCLELIVEVSTHGVEAIDDA